MAKFAGNVGYEVQVEGPKGIWSSKIVDRFMRGDSLTNSVNRENDPVVNQSISLNKRISIIADAFAFENMFNIVYVEYKGKKWRVSEVSDNRPRLTLQLGGLYNE